MKLRKPHCLTVAFLWIAAVACAYTVVDSGDKSPVVGATVIGKSGIILGLTDNDGRIAVSNPRDLPITVRCLGYDQVEYAGTNDTIALTPADYHLKEVVVSPAERPITRVVCFGREYCTGVFGSDTMQLYCEYMSEAFLVDGKVKGYKKSDADLKEKNCRMYARISHGDGLAWFFRPKRDDEVVMLAWYPYFASFPAEGMVMPQPLTDGADADTIMGKYGPKVMYFKKNNTFSRTINFLSDHKEGVWSPWFLKMIGMTVDFKDFTETESYAVNDRGIYGRYDFVSAAYNIHMLARGKIIKKAMGTSDPIDMDSFFELFPVEMTHCTIEEYKELRSDKDKIPFKTPADLPPLSPAVQSLVDAIDR